MSTLEGAEEGGGGRAGRGEGGAAEVAETQRGLTREGECSLEVSVPSEFEISSTEVEKLLEQQGKENFILHAVTWLYVCVPDRV